jgi:uncharacterized protein
MEVLSIESYFANASNGKLTGLLCEKDHVTTPPRHSCSTCKSTELSIVELSGKGEILSYTQVFVKSKEFPIETPFMLALVKLTEGPRLLGVFEGEDIRTGLKVRVNFRQIHGGLERPRIFFKPDLP